MNFTESDLYPCFLLALVVWREARGEPVPGKLAVAWSIRNRVQHPSWWGQDWVTVILKPWQYSSFNPTDPNAVKWPSETDSAWQACLDVATQVYAGQGTDPTSGAHSYYDDSIPPPEWTKAMTATVKVGALNFFR